MELENKQLGSVALQGPEIGPGEILAQIFSVGEDFSLADDAVLCVDSSRRIAFCNKAASILWGWSCSEAVGMPFDMLLPERCRGEPGQQLDGFATHPGMQSLGGNLFCISFMRKNGEEFQVEASVGRATIGELTLMIVVVRDVYP
jgi:PAS domain S-box-containing protein